MIYHAFYDHTEEKSLPAAWALKLKYGSSITFDDTYGLNAAAITALIAALTDDSLTDVWILVDSAATHAAGNFTNDQVASLRAKMVTASKGTVANSGTCQSNATVTEIILAVGASIVNDFYNGMFIETAGTTAVFRKITDYVGATLTTTNVSTVTAITTTETYEVYTMSHVHEFGAQSTTNGKSCGELTWDSIFPNSTLPVLFHYMSKYKYAWDWGTAQAADGTTITLAATQGAGFRKTSANDAFNDGEVYIYSATTNKGSYATIADFVHSTKVATLDAVGWVGGTPATSILYRVMPNSSERFYDNYTELFVKTYFNDLTSAAQESEFKKLIDSSNKIGATSEPVTFDQDLVLLASYLAKGTAIFDHSIL